MFDQTTKKYWIMICDTHKHTRVFGRLYSTYPFTLLSAGTVGEKIIDKTLYYDKYIILICR